MSDALRTVLISLGTSLIVSLITFILGLRSGKNQADRQKMQELYKKLYSHFSELKKSIEEDRCRTWESYDHIEKDIDNLLKKLRKRAVEPFTFWETFFGAFADLFR